MTGYFIHQYLGYLMLLLHLHFLQENKNMKEKRKAEDDSLLGHSAV
jgi:hypothetical protein